MRTHETLVMSPTRELGPEMLSFRRFELSVIEGQDYGQRAEFGKDSVQVGVAQAADFVLTDPTVSRFHMRIDTEQDRFLLIDTGSTNGTYLDHYRIRAAYLEAETHIRVGTTVLCFKPLGEHTEVALPSLARFGPLVGHSRAMRKIYSLIERVASTRVPVIVEGETGTGKDLVARCIHEQSNRQKLPFEILDCSAVPENLIQSELFGHVRGAFTNAEYDRQGLFERAHGGTVFLDEVGELKLDLQPKLLRVLETSEVRPVGGNKAKRVDVRVICATHRSLRALVNQGYFREDLYFRLAGAKIDLPPLRERLEDVPLLVAHHLSLLRATGQQVPERLSERTMNAFLAHQWPGNVRELFAAINRAVLGLEDQTPQGGVAPLAPETTLSTQAVIPLWQAREAFERQYLTQLLRRYGSNLDEAARVSDMHPKSLSRLLRKYRIANAVAPGDADDDTDDDE